MSEDKELNIVKRAIEAPMDDEKLAGVVVFVRDGLNQTLFIEEPHVGGFYVLPRGKDVEWVQEYILKKCHMTDPGKVTPTFRIVRAGPSWLGEEGRKPHRVVLMQNTKFDDCFLYEDGPHYKWRDVQHTKGDRSTPVKKDDGIYPHDFVLARKTASVYGLYENRTD